MRFATLVTGVLALISGASATLTNPHLRAETQTAVAPVRAAVTHVSEVIPTLFVRPPASTTPSTATTTLPRIMTPRKPAGLPPVLSVLPKSAKATTTVSAPPVVAAQPKNPVTPVVTVPPPIPATPAPAVTPHVATTTVAPTFVPATIASTSPAAPPVPGETAALDTVLPRLRAATVNILCLPDDRTKRGISGTGVIIDSRGVIITAAHVGQFVLLSSIQKPYQCTIRMGNPATSAYTASVVYVSPSWVRANAGTITATDPTGTGENDFALLAITGSATSAAVPASFPSVPLSIAEPTVGEPVVINTYGAEFLDGAHIRSSLYSTNGFSTIKQKYTFGTNTVDILSLGGGATAQEGSSGGGVADESGHIVGVITTSSTGKDVSLRDLHTITPGHIRRSFMSDMGASLDSYLSDTSIPALIKSFSVEAQSLTNMLVQANNLNG